MHCLISCAYSMGALGMPMVFGFREEAVGLRCTLVGLFGGGVYERLARRIALAGASSSLFGVGASSASLAGGV